MSAPGAAPPTVPDSIEARLADLAEALPAVELVVLFGSTVRGTATRRSDIDVGVRCAGAADLDAAYRALAPRFGTERLLQETIEAALDVNAHLIAELGAEVPDEQYPRYIAAVEAFLTREAG